LEKKPGESPHVFMGVIYTCNAKHVRGFEEFATRGPLSFVPAQVFLVDIINLDELMKEFEKDSKSGADPFMKEKNVVRAGLAIFGAAEGDRGDTCCEFLRFSVQFLRNGFDRRGIFLMLLVASSHFIGKARYNELRKENFTVDQFTAEMDYLSDGDYSRRLQAAEARADAAEAENARLKDEIARLTAALEKNGGPKNGGGR
jgi:hypothetical protein